MMEPKINKRREIIQPLLFDRVMEGRPRQSQSRLIQLPSELLTNIIALLADDKLTLASLAFVNSDCRQLARSCQFAEVTLNPHHPDLEGIYQKLYNETLARDNTIQNLTIGACIRRVTASNRSASNRPRYICAKYPINRRALEAGRFLKETRDNLPTIISKAMTNLDDLTWRYLGVDDSFLTHPSHSLARHLVVRELVIDRPQILMPAATPALLPLRSLSLDIRFSEHRSGNWSESSREKIKDGQMVLRPTRELCDIAFQRFASTLESLQWSYNGPKHVVSFGNSLVPFPRLRTADLTHLRDASANVFASLLSAPLTHLALPCDLKRVDIQEPLEICANFRNLETLVMLGLDTMPPAITDAVLGFLARHSHIEKLHIGEINRNYFDKKLRDSHIVPMLSKDFTSLRSLWIQFTGSIKSNAVQESPEHRDDFTIPEASLECIGSIATLEQLHISAGLGNHNSGWLIHHGRLQKHLSPLKQLKRLAFSHDTYYFPEDGFQGYYSAHFLDAAGELKARERPELNTKDGVSRYAIWERAHRNRMLDEAEQYAATLPNLEWVLSGQRLMDIRKSPVSWEPVKASPLTRERDTCRDFLEEVFGMKRVAGPEK